MESYLAGWSLGKEGLDMGEKRFRFVIMISIFKLAQIKMTGSMGSQVFWVPNLTQAAMKKDQTVFSRIRKGNVIVFDKEIQPCTN
jgi:hypothetical protein